MDKYMEYIKRKLEDTSLEDLFEQFGLDPEQVLLQMHLNGSYDIEYFMEDEMVEDDEPEE